MPAATRPAARAPVEDLVQARPRGAGGEAVAAFDRDDEDEEALARALAAAMRLELRRAAASLLAVRFATTSVTWNAPWSWRMSVTMCSTGTPAASLMRSTKSRRSQPEAAAGSVETMTWSGWCSATASIVAV